MHEIILTSGWIFSKFAYIYAFIYICDRDKFKDLLDLDDVDPFCKVIGASSNAYQSIFLN